MIEREFENIVGFDFILGLLKPKNSLGEKRIKHRHLIKDRKLLQNEINLVEELLNFIINHPKEYELLSSKLECVVDVSRTVESIKKGVDVDEIELFELKNFVLMAEDIRETFTGKLNPVFITEDLSDILELLDPENSKSPTFYIYDAYSEELKKVRRQKREITDKDSQEYINLTQLETEIEKKVLIFLNSKTRERIDSILVSLERIGYLDFVLSKAEIANFLGLSKPVIEECEVLSFKKFFNPILKENLEKKGKKYQTIDIEIPKGVTLLIGANMCGKTVTIRTIALTQYLTQLGYFVPCESTKTTIFDEILILSGDNQQPLNGISSFVAEIKEIDKIIKHSKADKKILVLLDEPARTTNPVEGQAIVNSIVENLTNTNTYALIVTHFDGIKAPRYLRVKGLKDGKIDPEKLEESIDYSLIEELDPTIVPHEALRVMEVIGVDNSLLDNAKKHLRGG